MSLRKKIFVYPSAAKGGEEIHLLDYPSRSEGSRRGFILFASILAFLVFPSLALAVQLENPIQAQTFKELILKITEFIRDIAWILAPVLIVVAGFMFMLSQGDPQKVTTAKNIILYTLIGLLIIVIATALITLIKQKLGVPEA